MKVQRLMSRLLEEQIQTFRSLAGEMIPASEEYGLPGADDEKIFDTILTAAESDWFLVEEGINALRAKSKIRYGKEFYLLDDQTRSNLGNGFLESADPYVSAIINATLQCYYRDDRVVISLGMEARPPFPIGYKVKQGDWTLLDTVKKRTKIYREI